MSALDNLIYEYQNVLLGKSKASRVPLAVWQNDERYNSDLAERFLREYVVEKMLGWSPYEMYKKFNRSVIRQLHLSPILGKIILPTEAIREDYFVYAHILYPDIIPFDFKSMTILMYNRILSGTVKRYPRGFFSDTYGKKRAKLCLRYVLFQKNAFSDSDNLYRQFIGDAGKKLLESHKLTLAYEYQYEDPIDYLHDSLEPGERDDFIYKFYKAFPSLPFTPKEGEEEEEEEKKPRKKKKKVTKRKSCRLTTALLFRRHATYLLYL